MYGGAETGAHLPDWGSIFSHTNAGIWIWPLGCVSHWAPATRSGLRSIYATGPLFFVRPRQDFHKQKSPEKSAHFAAANPSFQGPNLGFLESGAGRQPKQPAVPRLELAFSPKHLPRTPLFPAAQLSGSLQQPLRSNPRSQQPNRTTYRTTYTRSIERFCGHTTFFFLFQLQTRFAESISPSHLDCHISSIITINININI